MRPIYKGTISFGLINIPVGLYAATKEHELSFKLLHKKDLSEIRYARICKEEDKEVPYNQIIRGIEKNGRYVVVTEADFKKAEGEKSKIIEILAFCDEKEIDSIYYETPYYLKAEKGGEKAYFLLSQALKKSKKLALVRYTLKNRSHLAAIKFYDNILLLNQLRFQSQLIDIKDLGLSEKIRATPKEIEMAQKLIEQLSEPFVPEKYHDTYIQDLKQAIKKKGPGTKIKEPVKTKAPKEKLAEVIDIMSLLKASIKETKQARK